MVWAHKSSYIPFASETSVMNVIYECDTRDNLSLIFQWILKDSLIFIDLILFNSTKILFYRPANNHWLSIPGSTSFVSVQGCILPLNYFKVSLLHNSTKKNSIFTS